MGKQERGIIEFEIKLAKLFARSRENLVNVDFSLDWRIKRLLGVDNCLRDSFFSSLSRSRRCRHRPSSSSSSTLTVNSIDACHPTLVDSR